MTITNMTCIKSGFIICERLSICDEKCLVHTTDTDKTRLSCLVCVGGVNRIADKSILFLVVLNILETEQFRPVLSTAFANKS